MCKGAESDGLDSFDITLKEFKEKLPELLLKLTATENEQNLQ